jgi:hypothetical protein
LLPACHGCNGIKSNASVDTFRRRLARIVAGWPKFTEEQLRWLKDRGMEPPSHFTFYGETIGLTIPEKKPK